MASWYGEPFHGRRTANGEIYDMHGISAAHKELPLGTIIHVTNLENGRQLQMRVNDRGPYIKGRILDLSYGAAQKLDVVRAGLAKVEIRVVEVGEGRPGPALTSRYTIQVGAFGDRDNALKLQRALTAEYAAVEIVPGEGLHRVRVGNFKERSEAEKVRKKLRRRGLAAIIVPLK
jgi:rare lipoprotein A